MRFSRLLILSVLAIGSLSTTVADVNNKAVKQLVLGITDDWNSSYVNLKFYERAPLNPNKWKLVDGWSGRVGKKGLAWGIGLHPLPKEPVMKREGDARTPAGIFDISVGAWGYAPMVKKKSSLPYRRITSRSLFYEDVKSPYYNDFRVIDHEPRTDAEKAAQMKQGDPAHSLKLFISHNTNPRPRPGYGSSIFFHIWREDGKKPTAGCTTMSEKSLRSLISRVDPNKNPRYVILPKVVYEAVKDQWQLP